MHNIVHISRTGMGAPYAPMPILASFICKDQKDYLEQNTLQKDALLGRYLILSPMRLTCLWLMGAL